MGNCWKQKAKDWLWQQVGNVCGKSSDYAKQMDSVDYYNFHKDGVANSCALFCDCSVLNSCTEPTFDEDPEGAKWTALSAMYEPQNGSNAGAGCVQKVSYFRSVGEYYTDTQDFCELDELFLASPEYVKPDNPEGLYHTGMIVAWGFIEELGKEGFTIIDGNSTFEGEKGRVGYHYYAYDDPRIHGAGRPNWDGWEPENNDDDDKPTPEPTPEPVDKTVLIKMNVLSRGSTGGQVNTLKALLNEFGWADDLPLDGDFDRDTEEAVNKYKNAYGLEENGIVDEETWNLILR